MRKLIFVDGDIILYKACFASEMEIYWGDGDWTLSMNEEQAKTVAREIIEDIRLACSVKKSTIRICFSNGKSFRKDVYPEYKANRKNLRKPLGFKALKRWLAHEYKSIQYDYLEADDVIGIHMTKPGKMIKIAVSIDKDMKTIPGIHYNPDTGESFEITEAEADYNFYRQTLTGDSTDNYPGCPSVGPKTADKILEKHKPEEYWMQSLEHTEKTMLKMSFKWLDWQEYYAGKILTFLPRPLFFGILMGLVFLEPLLYRRFFIFTAIYLTCLDSFQNYRNGSANNC